MIFSFSLDLVEQRYTWQMDDSRILGIKVSFRAIRNSRSSSRMLLTCEILVKFNMLCQIFISKENWHLSTNVIVGFHYLIMINFIIYIRQETHSYIY